MPDSIPLKINGEEPLEGVHPVVVIGPNGSGKTRYGVRLADLNKAELIGALRQIALSPTVAVYSAQQSETNLRNVLRRRRSRPWELSSEIEHLFAKLLVEDYAAAVRYREQSSASGSATPEQTKLMTISSLWNRLFPGREISFAGNTPKVLSTLLAEPAEYPAQEMSDGERVALYLAGRVLDSEAQIIIVDEPEVHFHNRLAVQFWDELERLKPGCRFVYITHSLPFALSREGAEFLVVRPNATPEVVCIEDGFPSDLAESVLSAASFSIHATRIVFCEGARGRSVDEALYSAWFSGRDTVVIPVGGSGELLRCTRAFGRPELVTGVTSVGIIDRDCWPDQYISSLPDTVHPLPVHEVENLLCLRGVFNAVAHHHAIPEEEVSSRYAAFLQGARGLFRGSLLSKQISERFRTRCEHEFKSVVRGVEVGDDLTTVQAAHVAALSPARWPIDPEALFSDQRQLVEHAVSASEEEFLRVLPGKAFWKHAAEELGLHAQAYLGLVCGALRGEEPLRSSALGQQLEECLTNYLPPRTLPA